MSKTVELNIPKTAAERVGDGKQRAGDVLDIGGQSWAGYGLGAIQIRVATGPAGWEWREITDGERSTILAFLNQQRKTR